MIDKLIDDCIKLGGLMYAHIDSYSEYRSIVRDSNSELYSVFNKGRDSIASNFAQTAIFTTVKDEWRCETCRLLQGKRFKVGTNEYNENMPPLHNHCRCIYQYILGRNY
jgi:SPP1 gp7 family putative phage head morphogenesis protein